MLRREVTTFVQLLTRTITCYTNASKLANWDAYNRAVDRLCRIMEFAPDGNGLVTRVGSVRYIQGVLLIECSYHHMINGMYTEWTDHIVQVTPNLEYGYSIKCTGRNRHGIKSYLEAEFDQWLSAKVERTWDTEIPEWEGIVLHDPYRKLDLTENSTILSDGNLTIGDDSGYTKQQNQIADVW